MIMRQTGSIKEKIWQLMAILGPILVTQVSLCAMAFFDTTMSGHASAKDLAGVAIGGSIWMPVFTGISGILYAVVPLIGHLLGAERKDKIPFVLIQGIYLAIIVAVAVIGCGALLLQPILSSMKLEPQVYEIARRFLQGIAVGIVPFFVYTVLRCFIDALGYTRISMLISLLAIPINVGLNYVLIFGKFGFPHLGGVGAGYASSITYWFITLFSFYIIWRCKPFSGYRVFSKIYRCSLPAWREQLSIGLPIGFSIFFETSIFGVVTLLMSRFNTSTIAAHQVALNFASLVYMIPLSISMALAILVGFEAGAGRFKDARQYCRIGIGFALVMAVCCAVLLLEYSDQVAGLYSKNEEVIRLGSRFLMYAAFFQLSDALAAPIQGTLRGYKDVMFAFVSGLFSCWAIGLPVGYWLSEQSAFGPFGFWLGLIMGLASNAVCLSVRLHIVQKRQE
jgi:MATE family multidrug resistance protein